MVFLPRPNAPTGVAAPIEQVERICKQFDGLVFIDEAYVDFADNHCLELVTRFANVIVGRTCSKSFSLAGLRLGFAFAQPDTIAEFMKTKDSYNLNALTQALGKAALSDMDWVAANAKKIRATRRRLSATLRALGFRVPESQANFVLALWDGQPPAHELFERLRRRGLLVRYFEAPRLEKALRITVGTEAETDALLDALRDMCE
jgi:histidinol-phosphate aminotransferase